MGRVSAGARRRVWAAVLAAAAAAASVGVASAGVTSSSEFASGSAPAGASAAGPAAPAGPPLAATPAGEGARPGGDPRIDPAVARALRVEPRTQVLMQLDLRGERARRPRRREVRRAVSGLLADLAAASARRGGSFEVIGRFDGLRVVAARVDARAAVAAAGHPLVRRVLPDSGGRAALLESLPLVRLSDTRAAGFGGDGLSVAVIDSGIDLSHPSFSGAVIDQACFCSARCCPNGQSTQFGPGAARDQNGHGTNVAGVIAGRGIDAPQGAIPAAGIVAVRVLDKNGNFSTSADITAALNWLGQKHPEVAAVNMSLETWARYPVECDAWYPDMAARVAVLGAGGAMLVAATGNEADLKNVAAPACLRDVIGVAAVWDAAQQAPGFSVCNDGYVQADQIACFGNRGPLADLLAPGGAVTATGLGGGASTYYGTSQAAPMVTACAAVLSEANREARPGQKLHALQTSPANLFDAPTGRTYPRLDCARAVEVATTLCGDANDDGNVLASDALAVLNKAVGSPIACPVERCDLDGDGNVLASDALRTLKRAVGQQVEVSCSGGI